MTRVLHTDTCLGYAANEQDLDCACHLAPKKDEPFHTSECIALAHETGDSRCICIDLFPVVLDTPLAFLPGGVAPLDELAMAWCF